MSLKIDSEFKNLIPPLAKEEYQQLEENIAKEGCYDALITWDGTLVDGHNRYEICTRRKIHFDTKAMNFGSRDEVKEWIIRHQFGRRNISTAQRCDLVLKLEDVIKARAKENQKGGQGGTLLNQKSDEANKVNTNNELGKLAGVSHNTMHQFRVVKKEGAPELQQKVLSGEVSINKAYEGIRKKEDEPVIKKPNKFESKEEEVKKCKQCGRTKFASEFYEGRAICSKCHSCARQGENDTKIDGDQIFREITDIGAINKISYSHIVSEIEQIINGFSNSISNYAYKKQAIESLSLDERKHIRASLEKAESWINQIINLLEG